MFSMQPISQFDKHVPDSPCQQLTITSIVGVEEIKDSMLDCMASPASKAFPGSRLHCLMFFVLPSARCRVRDLSSPQDDYSASWHIREWCSDQLQLGLKCQYQRMGLS